MLPRLYHALTGLVTPLVLALLWQRRRRGKEDPSRYGERLGRPGLARPEGSLLWIHAASVGEAAGMLGLIERLLWERPQLQILVTTGTVTSASILARRLPPRARHQFAPVDLPAAVNRFLDHWRPDLAIWVESELWPNLILAARSRDVPLILVNGRVSERSFRHWRRSSGLIEPVLKSFALCLTQDATQCLRFSALGASEVEPAGDLKAAAGVLPVDDRELVRLRQATEARPLWLAASTHPGEEEIVAQAHQLVAAAHPRLLTIIAPRHPMRGDAIERALAAQGLRTARRSKHQPITRDTEIYLADTMGELGLFYRLARISFIGGSLSGNGGHNPFEAARLGCAVLHGPDVSNCAAMATALATAGASETVADAEELGRAVSALLDNPDLCATRRDAGIKVAAEGEQVLDIVLARLAPWLDPLAPAGDGLPALAFRGA